MSAANDKGQQHHTHIATQVAPPATSTGDHHEANLADHLFDYKHLTGLTEWGNVSTQLGARNLSARPLRLADYENGYLDLLSQLTSVGEIKPTEYSNRFKQMKQINELEVHYVIVVIEDSTTKRIVGASTLFLEFKFIHQCAIRGRLEDVAVLDSYRGKQIGELVVRLIVELAREAFKCYKLTLDCKDELIKFYSKNNFVRGANMLSIRFN